ncbi:hypothetical protein HDU96_007229 [Phlyctochytrium bullatum]|nr:hypothetical protein HDU96_007229 [Phlyctochytrium bullatum]
MSLEEKEFKELKEETPVYKLIGPVLVKQDLVEAKVNVDKRLQYIRSEMWVLDKAVKHLHVIRERVEKLIQTLEEKQEQQKTEIIKMQAAVSAP